MMQLTIGVVLPHVQIFGGVKRFLEIGNLLVRKNHRFLVFTPEGLKPEWFAFEGEIRPLTDLPGFALDALFTTEPVFVPQLRAANARLKIFYAVIERSFVKKLLREKDTIVFANSSNVFRYLNGERNNHVVKAIGGIDVNKFAFREKAARRDGDPFVVMAYGRFYRRKKGTMLIVRACEKLYSQGYNIKLHLFDTPVDEPSRAKIKAFKCKVPFEFFVDHPVSKVQELYYQADVFVSAERNAGWCNTAAEAMSCGIPVIATRSGTTDFLVHEETGLEVWRYSWFIRRAIRRLIDDQHLHQSLIKPARAKIEEFSWESLAGNIEKILMSRLAK
jgi:glycosyltransferase involved in cell wall biosynthesis